MNTSRVRPHPAKGIITAQGRHQYEVAAEVGCNPNSLGRVLNRHEPIPPWLPERLAAVLGVEVSELFDELDAVAS